MVAAAFLSLASGRGLRHASMRDATAPRRRRRHAAQCVVSRVAAASIPPRKVDLFSPDALPTPADLQGVDRKKVVVIGAGLAGLVTAMELLDSGVCDVQLYDGRPFVGGKVGSWTDSAGNHIEMGLHVFFGCYYNLFDIMKNKLDTFDSLLLKSHQHQFVNKGGKIGELDFRMGGVGAPFNGLKAFATTNQLSVADKLANALALGTSPIVRGLVDFDGAMNNIRDLDDISFAEWFQSKGGSRGSIERMWNPVAYALGFLDCDDISARCMLTIFQLFATRSEASVLRLLEGSPNTYLTGPMVDYIEERGGKVNLRTFVRNINYTTQPDGSFAATGIEVATVEDKPSQTVEADLVVAACDVPGIQKVLPEPWRKHKELDNIYKLATVPVITVQLRFDGWVTELADQEKRVDLTPGKRHGLDNLLYSADADFSCFADLALTSPSDYYKEGQGSLLQCVITPADPYMPLSDKEITAKMLEQARALFPSARDIECTWSSVVKLAQSLYREEPGTDVLRPYQRTSVENFYLAGSYTQQDYIDSMEGACKSGRLAATAILQDILAAKKMS